MKDDIQTNVYFIELIKKNPCLYNTTRSDYNNRNKQNIIWNELAQEFNETVTTCRDRWKNIRGRYVKQLKKPRPGKSKKPYYLADYLGFLDAFIKCRTFEGNLQTQSPKNTDERSNSSVDLSDIDGESSTGLKNVSENSRRGISNPLETDTSASTTPEPSEGFEARSNTKRLRNKRSIAANDLNCAVTNYFQTKKKRQNTASEVIDPDEAFLKSVLPDMKNMNEYQKRHFKVAVLQLAGQILNEPVITPSSCLSTSIEASSAETGKTKYVYKQEPTD